MRNCLTCYLVILILTGSLHAGVNTPGAGTLTKRPGAAKTDTAQVRAKYLACFKNARVSPGYLDSLAAEAGQYGMKHIAQKALLMAGNLCLNSGEQDQGYRYLDGSYLIALATGDKPGMMECLLRITRYFYRKDDIKKALENCYEGLKIAEETNDQLNIANFHAEAALCYFATGEIKRSLGLHFSCLQSYRLAKSDLGMVNTLMDIGSDYHALKQDNMAATWYLKCKDYLNRINTGNIYIDILNSLSSGYFMLRQYDSAYRYARMSYEAARKSAGKIYMVSTMTMLAIVTYQKGSNAEARAIAEKALDMAKTTDFKMSIPELTQILKKIYLKDKDYKKALETYELYVEAKDSLFSQDKRKEALEKEFGYNLAKKENELLAQQNQNQLQELKLRQNSYIVAGLGILVLLVIAFALLFARQNKLKNEQKNAQLEQKLLRLQMNPHFIFNCLQAIQNFILKEDKRQAESYLGSFASVMRNVLENSIMETILLKKEIGLLESYLSLQKLRFGNRFAYTTHIGKTVDTEHISVPPMLAQPFIENAIEHGFHSISSGGMITISYAVQNDTLLMEITDNGTGMTDNYEQSKQHRSLAIEITSARIALLNKKNSGKVSFSISDAFPFEKDRRGVKVTFILPLNLQA